MMVLREGMNMLEFAHFKHLLSTAVALMLSSGNLCNSQEILKKEYHVEEEGGVGVHVGSPGRDSGLFSKFRTDMHLLMFQPFAQGNEHMPYFTVNASNGVVRTARNIDRETLCPGVKVCSVKLSVAVYRRSPSSESPTLLNILEVVVIIDDINDNNPTFPSPVVSLSVPENLEANYQIETSVAVDADEEGPNSRVTYRLEPPRDMFELSTVKTADGVEDLVVTIKRTLDREEKSQYSLVVVATDLGDDPKSGSVLINILVKDMNDNAPYFSRLNYSVNVLENSDITVPVVIVSASDRDHGENARLTYSLGFQVPQDIKDSFVVDPETGNIFARKELDHESKQAYQFSVIVSDHGSPSRSNFAYVSINVIDVNDNVPHIQINPAPGGESVVEHGSVGKFLAYIKVSDADSRDYGQVSCDMRDGNFILEPLDVTSRGIYKIKLRYALDREESRTRNVVIVCQDGDIRPLSASASFTVTVEDINDNPPQFIGSSLMGSVMENENENTYVLRVMAADADEGRNGKISFAITSGNEKSLFAINEDNGIISTTEMLDREVKSQYFLQVTASDHGYYSLTSSATVTINVLDENDNPPKFKKQAFFNNIMENLLAGSEAGSIAAYDLDHGDNAKLVFSIVHEGMGSLDGLSFRVDRNRGSLYSVVKFNREEKSTFKFRVKVADPVIASYYDIANVTVFIEDANDHSPVVVKPLSGNRTFRCPFNTTVGEVITTFIATDNDDPELVKISYSIANTNLNSPKWPLFSIDSISGKLRLARRIRPEDVTKHNLEVVVRDGPGITSQSTTVTISVIVEEGDAEAMRAFIDESATNIVVVIIIIAATIILAFIIVAVIYLIKRVDRKRHRQLPPASSDENNKLYQAAKWVSAMSVTREIGPEEIRSILEMPLEEKKKKKEVSFSLAERVAHTPGDHLAPGKTVDLQLKTFQATEGLPLHLTARQEDYIVINGITTPDYSQHLYDPPTSSTDHQDDHHFMEVRHSDDRYSDASSGDTGTSDSGRGGSEDECHGHANSSTDGEKRRFAGSNSLNRGLNPKPNKKCNDTNSLKRMKQRQSSSSRDGDEVPGSPTPLLSDRDRQSDSHHSSQHRPLDMDGNARLQRSFDKLPVRPAGSPSSARSSPSPSLTNQALTYTRQPRYSSELLLLCHADSDGPYRAHTGEQQHLLLQTFSSPHATGAPRYNSHPSWRRVKGLDPSRGPAPRKQYDDKTSTADDSAIAPMDLTDVRSSDVLV